MAASTAQQADLLFKLIFGGVSETSTTRQFFEEPDLSRPAVYPTQIWADYAKIPTTAPGGTDGQVTGVVTRYIARSMSAVAGTSNSFRLAQLKNAIPFNFGDGSYNYSLTDSTGTAIPFGSGDWVVDPSAGVLTFFGSVPGNMPPKISFYAYTGQVGAANDIVAETQVTLAENTTTNNITALLFSGSTYKTVIVKYQLYRVSTGGSGVEINGGGRVAFTYKPTAASWNPTPLEQWGDDPLFTLSITSAGQIQGTLAAIAGTSPVSTLTFKAEGFRA